MNITITISYPRKRTMELEDNFNLGPNFFNYLCLLFINLDGYVHVVLICPGSSDPFYIISYYIRWDTTSWKHSKQNQ